MLLTAMLAGDHRKLLRTEGFVDPIFCWRLRLWGFLIPVDHIHQGCGRVASSLSRYQSKALRSCPHQQTGSSAGREAAPQLLARPCAASPEGCI